MPTLPTSVLAALSLALAACAHDRPPPPPAPAPQPSTAPPPAATLFPADPSERPRVAPITAIERHLIAGEREPHLPEAVRDRFYVAGRRNPAFMFKLCIDGQGRPTEIAQVGRGNQRIKYDLVDTAETSPELLAYFHNTLAAWRFEPYLENGRPVPLCTAILFVYRIDPARPRR